MSRKEDWTREEIERDYVATMTAITVPVNFRLEGKTQIFDLSEVEAILRNATKISLGECGCRRFMQKCDGPLDVCIGLDQEAETLFTKGKAKQVDLDEALDALRQSHEAGLVHISYIEKGREKPFIICSCCSCCCHSLSGLIRFGIPEAVVSSNYVAVHQQNACTGCGFCVERCQFKARQLQNGKLVYDSSKCFGCGLCMTTCPSNANALKERS